MVARSERGEREEEKAAAPRCLKVCCNPAVTMSNSLERAQQSVAAYANRYASPAAQRFDLSHYHKTRCVGNLLESVTV